MIGNDDGRRVVMMMIIKEKSSYREQRTEDWRHPHPPLDRGTLFCLTELVKRHAGSDKFEFLSAGGRALISPKNRQKAKPAKNLVQCSQRSPGLVGGEVHQIPLPKAEEVSKKNMSFERTRVFSRKTPIQTQSKPEAGTTRPLGSGGGAGRRTQRVRRELLTGIPSPRYQFTPLVLHL